MSGVLNGIRVVEQGTFITGPCAGMMLADLGADVVKVESPDGDPYRSYQGGNFLFFFNFPVYKAFNFRVVQVKANHFGSPAGSTA